MCDTSIAKDVSQTKEAQLNSSFLYDMILFLFVETVMLVLTIFGNVTVKMSFLLRIWKNATVMLGFLIKDENIGLFWAIFGQMVLAYIWTFSSHFYRMIIQYRQFLYINFGYNGYTLLWHYISIRIWTSCTLGPFFLFSPSELFQFFGHNTICFSCGTDQLHLHWCKCPFWYRLWTLMYIKAVQCLITSFHSCRGTSTSPNAH